jgi:hypothetical protein
MNQDVAVFLDLDNVVIGATEANLKFDVNLALDALAEVTGGRMVLRRAYGDWRQRSTLVKELAEAGFELQSAVRLSSSSKNLADMQLVVDAMTTLIDGRDYGTYALITGDRDFAPLVHALRKRGRRVVGLGLRHAASQNLVRLCDQYVFYDELATGEEPAMTEEQLAELLERSLGQLLQEEERVPASLLKQRVQALSRGAFGRSPHGRRSFHKLLAEHAGLVGTELVDTTLYVRRPVEPAAAAPKVNAARRHLSPEEVTALLERALDDLLADQPQVRASVVKQQLQDLSDGAFDETALGDKNFRKFLDRYKQLVRLELEGSTLYVARREDGAADAALVTQSTLAAGEVDVLLTAALDYLLVDQPRARASLLKQTMQAMSDGAFDEGALGYDSFRQLLEDHADLVQVQQKGTTLLVYRPAPWVEPGELHLHYRSELKKRGYRVVPADVRLRVLRDIITVIQRRPNIPWRPLVDQLYAYYVRAGREDLSKSYINDVLRIARRAGVIAVDDDGSLASAPVSLLVSGERAFQEAVIRCDAAFLGEIQSLPDPFDLKEAAIALYETAAQARYLKVVMERYAGNGREEA